MHRLFHPVLLLALISLLWSTAWARDFKLLDGSTIAGEISDGNDYGVVFRLDIGGFTKRVSWSKFTQESLKLLAETAKLKPMVEPFIELPPDTNKPKPKAIQLREITRVERPLGRTTVFSSFTTPIGLAILALLYLGNLLAAYEIALYRNRPIAVACGVSALLPLLGPLIFLVSPSLEPSPETADTAAPEPPGPAPTVAAASSPAAATSRKVGVPQAPAGGGLRVAATQDKAGAGGAEGPKIFNRGDYTFNRRFIETQFSGFFRVVPLEAEKDLVLVVKTAKSEFVGKRISRISMSEFYLQLLQTAGKEVCIPFSEIAQVAVRNKDEIRD